jgi:hypothetical protein
MQRRRFLAMMGIAPVALVGAKTAILSDVFFKPPALTITWCPIEETMTWTGCWVEFEPGDVVVVSGFTNDYANGTYRMNEFFGFEQIA